MNTKQLYIAILLFERKSSNPKQGPLFEENTLLVNASSQTEAEQLAEDFGRNHKPSFTNESGDAITWEFLEVEDVNEVLEEPGEAAVTCLNSRFFTNKAAYDTFREMLTED